MLSSTTQFLGKEVLMIDSTLETGKEDSIKASELSGFGVAIDDVKKRLAIF
jgi:hypothetical protein